MQGVSGILCERVPEPTSLTDDICQHVDIVIFCLSLFLHLSCPCFFYYLPVPYALWLICAPVCI